MNAYELAKKYYPLLWDINRINALYKVDKLSEEEYNEIINETSEETE